MHIWLSKKKKLNSELKLYLHAHSQTMQILLVKILITLNNFTVINTENDSTTISISN